MSRPSRQSVPASRPRRGSSTCGSCSSALPSPIRIFHPPEKAVTGSSASDGEKPIALIILSARFSMAPASDASSCACSSAIVSSAPCIASASSPAAASAASASSYRARSESTFRKERGGARQRGRWRVGTGGGGGEGCSQAAAREGESLAARLAPRLRTPRLRSSTALLDCAPLDRRGYFSATSLSRSRLRKDGEHLVPQRAVVAELLAELLPQKGNLDVRR